MSEEELDETVHEKTCFIRWNLQRNKETDCHVFAASLAPECYFNMLKIYILF